MSEGLADEFAAEVAAQGDNAEIVAILFEVCELTGMGFAAVARVTEDRWIAAQVLDRIEFGLKPGHELKVSTTICDEIRDSGEAVVIDDVTGNDSWCRHPTPIMYGFKSYASFPIYLGDGSFYGTLCAIDPRARTVSLAVTVATLEGYAKRVAEILSAKQPA
ncbi:MAG: GAF domain-containing protein [Pseudomonadota bacterium]